MIVCRKIDSPLTLLINRIIDQEIIIPVCSHRPEAQIQALEKKGVIEEYTTIIDRQSVPGYVISV